MITTTRQHILNAIVKQLAYLDHINYILVNAHGCYNWKSTFIIFPRMTISKKVVWFTHIYKRKIRVVFHRGYVPIDVTPFTDVIQYGNAFDILNNKYDSKIKI